MPNPRCLRSIPLRPPAPAAPGNVLCESRLLTKHYGARRILVLHYLLIGTAPFKSMGREKGSNKKPRRRGGDVPSPGLLQSPGSTGAAPLAPAGAGRSRPTGAAAAVSATAVSSSRRELAEVWEAVDGCCSGACTGEGRAEAATTRAQRAGACVPKAPRAGCAVMRALLLVVSEGIVKGG